MCNFEIPITIPETNQIFTVTPSTTVNKKKFIIKIYIIFMLFLKSYKSYKKILILKNNQPYCIDPIQPILLIHLVQHFSICMKTLYLK